MNAPTKMGATPAIQMARASTLQALTPAAAMLGSLVMASLATVSISLCILF